MHIQFTDQQLDYVFKVLATRPWQEVAPLMQEIQKQVTQQQQVLVPPPVQAVTKANAEPEPAGLND